MSTVVCVCEVLTDSAASKLVSHPVWTSSVQLCGLIRLQYLSLKVYCFSSFFNIFLNLSMEAEEAPVHLVLSLQGSRTVFCWDILFK